MFYDHEAIIGRLRLGETLCIVRKDDPILHLVLDLQARGLVTSEVVQLDEQSSEMRVRATELLLRREP